MTHCCHIETTEQHFDRGHAEGELVRYRKRGLRRPARVLLAALSRHDIHDLTVLDIGSGIGALSAEFSDHGVAKVVLVEISAGFLEAAQNHAQNTGCIDKLEFVHGDFVEMAHEFAVHDIVVLDRVVCCYHNWQELLQASTGKCRRWLLLSYPRDTWYSKLDTAVKNRRRRRRGNNFITFVHPAAKMRSVVVAGGFQRVFARATFLWQMEVYQRLDAV